MNTPLRPCTIIGNWKMHKTIEEAYLFVKEFLTTLTSTDKTVGLAVPFTAIYPLVKECKNSPLLIGGQNMNDASEGAFTGEIAGNMLIDAGAQFVILGHSERRILYHEENAFINKKIKRAIQVGLRPLLCIGEVQSQYEANETHQVLEKQLTEGLKDLQADELHQLMIAYEPVWAIGSGHSATPEMAQEVHLFCRQLLAKQFSEDFAQQVVIQYGGSVNSSNAYNLLVQPDIDGLLIGGASLSLESFSQIVNDSYSKNQSEG